LPKSGHWFAVAALPRQNGLGIALMKPGGCSTNRNQLLHQPCSSAGVVAHQRQSTGSSQHALVAWIHSDAFIGELPHLYHGLAFALIAAGIVASSRP